MSKVSTEEVITAIVHAAYGIHKKLGPGLLESVYEVVLALELEKLGFVVDTQKVLPLVWDGKLIEKAFRADMIVNGEIMVEIKAIDNLAPVHYKQLLTYLKVSDMHIGLLINFNQATLKGNIRRVVNNYNPDQPHS